MKITARTRYGLRAMVDLAAHAEEGPCALGALARRQQVSPGYLEQAFADLRKAGLVTGAKGPEGGYTLARPAERLSALDLLEALEGGLTGTPDTPAGKPESPEAAAAREVLRTRVWEPLDRAVAAALGSVTLAELAEAYRRADPGQGLLYYI